MEKAKAVYTTIDEYIQSFPKDLQAILTELRMVIKAAAPDCIENISYGMPAFSFKGYLVYFAAHKNHIGFYPIPQSINAFKNELSVFKTGKGSVQFPIDQPLPVELISKIVKYRVEENIKKEAEKLLNKKKKAGLITKSKDKKT